MRWQPRVTVAAVIEKDNKFLLVEEQIDGKLLLNQPAGHWEYGESLLDAVKREVLEETAWEFTPEYLVGIYQWQHPQQDQLTFLRFTFSGAIDNFHPEIQLDHPIQQTLWLDRAELAAKQAQHRSPQVLRCVDDYLNGKRFDLSLINIV